MIKKIIEASGKKCGLIGTTGVYIGNKHYPLKNTTPESYDTLKYMNEMVHDKIEVTKLDESNFFINRSPKITTLSFTEPGR